MSADAPETTTGHNEESLEELAAQYDHCQMTKVIDRLPNQIETAMAQELPVIPRGDFNQVIISGMGGSALPAEVVLDAFGDSLTVPLSVSRHYALPATADSRSLIIASSFSGSTEESTAAIESFPSGDQNVVVVTTGSRLAEIGNERGYPVIHIPADLEPEGFQPRSAVGYMVTYFARILFQAGLLPQESIAKLAAVPDFMRGFSSRSEAEDVARWLTDKIPLVYTDERHLMSIARIAKIKFNENSKRPAFFNSLPEANHNEMIGFTKPLVTYGLLYLHDPDSHPRVLERYRVMERVFADQGLDHVHFRRWDIPGETTVEKLFAALGFMERCSYALALLDHYDPTPVDLVERFKKELVKP